MARLSRSDLEAALEFGAEVSLAALHRERTDMRILKTIAELVGAETAAYSHFDASERLCRDTDYPSGKPWEPSAREFELLMTVNPFCSYASAAGQPHFFARRLTDVTDLGAFKRTELYELSFRTPVHYVQARMPAVDGGHWTLQLARSGREYSDRELLLIDTVRPFLIAYEVNRELAAKAAELRRQPAETISEATLTPREAEVLDLVAAGATNAVIANKLWITSATVRKHLENIYAKLDVRSRTAALARSGRSGGRTTRRKLRRIELRWRSTACTPGGREASQDD